MQWKLPGLAGAAWIAVAAASALATAQQAAPFHFPYIPPEPRVMAPHLEDGVLHLDLTVTNAQGEPVSGLSEDQLQLFDNGSPIPFASFHAYDGIHTFPPAPTQVVLILDDINLHPDQWRAVQTAVQQYLLANHGHLSHSTLLYRVAWNRVTASFIARVNGPDLVKELALPEGSRVVNELHRKPPQNSDSCAARAARTDVSLRALGSIVLDLRRQAGHKVVLWIGPGWTITDRGPCAGALDTGIFNWSTELSTRMREARITLDQVNIFASDDLNFGSDLYLDGAASRDTAHMGHLALPVLASLSGGRVFEASSGLDSLLRTASTDADVLYTATFNPPTTDTPDELHSLSVRVALPSATARCPRIYYNEPSFYDRQPLLAQHLSAAQIRERLLLPGESSKELLQRLASIEPTERLSSRLVRSWETGPHHPSFARILLPLSDLSQFAPPPAGNVLRRPGPTAEEQRQILGRAVSYLNKVIPALPDFSAIRTSTYFHELAPKVAPSKEDSWKTITGTGVLNVLGTRKEDLHYRDGAEVAEDPRRAAPPSRGEQGAMQVIGTFGPILNSILRDALPSLKFARWETDDQQLRAVFQFTVPQRASHYSINFCCMTDMDNNALLKWFTGYHGEISVDPDSGAILRIAIQADLNPALPTTRADILVEYAPVDIGGVAYICPVHSVAISRKRTKMAIADWGNAFTIFGPYITMLNDVTYSHFHKFGSTSRMLPGFVPAQ